MSCGIRVRSGAVGPGGGASGAGSFKRRASTRLRPRYVNTTQRGNNDGIAFWRVRIVAWLARMTYRYR